jgi:hypothetical protein
VTGQAIDQQVLALDGKTGVFVDAFRVENGPPIFVVAAGAVFTQPAPVYVLVARGTVGLDFRKVLNVVARQAVHPNVKAKQTEARPVVIETNVIERRWNVTVLATTLQHLVGAFVGRCPLRRCGAGREGRDGQLQQDND